MDKPFFNALGYVLAQFNYRTDFLKIILFHFVLQKILLDNGIIYILT